MSRSIGITRQLGGTIILIAVWVLLIGVGMRILLSYSSTPGPLAKPPAIWPAGVPIAPIPGKWELVLFAHPQCPCTRATLEELARIIASGKDRVETSVFFYVPPKSPRNWAKTDLWYSAADIPTVHVIADPDASAARQFGARTSGQVLLYDRAGNLAFTGGITASRGHSGDNDGRDAIVAMLLGRAEKRHSMPVFGCALFGDS